MRIRRIALERFGRLGQQQFEFGPGLNVIRGPNEAGKTTLREAILFALLGNPRHTTIEMQRDKRVNDRVSWGSGRRFHLALDLVDDTGAKYELVKDWCAQSARLTNCETGERIEDPDLVQRDLGRMTGCGSLKLFRSTVCVEQNAIEEVSAGRREIGDQLQGIVTGGADEASVSAVLAELNGKIAGMERGVRSHAPINPGPIKTVQNDMADTDIRLADVRSQVERAETAAQRLIELNASIATAEKELGSRRSVRDLCDRRFVLEDTLCSSKAAEDALERRIEKVREASDKLEQANQALTVYAALEAVDADAERELAQLHQRVTTLQEEVHQRSTEAEKLRKRRRAEAQPKPTRAAPFLIGAAIGLAVFGAGIAVGATRSWPLGVLIGLVGLALLAGSLAKLLLPMHESEPSDLASRISFADAELERDQQELVQATNELDGKLSPLACVTFDELVKRLADRKALVRQRDSAAVRLDTLLTDRPLEELSEERRVESRRRRDAEEALRDARMQTVAQYDAVGYEALRRDIGEREQKLENLKREAIECQTRSNAVSYTIEDVYGLEERRKVLESRLAYLEERLEVYRATREAIQEAKDQTMRSARDELGPRIGSYLERLTQGRYGRVQADEDLRLQVFSSEKDDWIAPGSGAMSRGTVDQLYLAVRLALLDLLFCEAKPPLLLDDPFVKFDADRREQAIVLCREMAKDHQVLLFTCHDDYDEAADRLIELPAP